MVIISPLIAIYYFEIDQFLFAFPERGNARKTTLNILWDTTGCRGARKQKIMGFFTLRMQNIRERSDHY